MKEKTGTEMKKELAKILLDYDVVLYDHDGEVSGSQLLEQIYNYMNGSDVVEMMTTIMNREIEGEKIF